MFKQVIIMVLFIIISYLVTKIIYKKKFNKFYIIPSIVKYPLKIKKLQKLKNVIKIKLSDIKDLNNMVFYTNEKINHNNYIYDIINDYYYLIEPEYYYYIKESKNFEFHYSDNLYIHYLILNSNSNSNSKLK